MAAVLLGDTLPRSLLSFSLCGLRPLAAPAGDPELRLGERWARACAREGWGAAQTGFAETQRGGISVLAEPPAFDV